MTHPSQLGPYAFQGLLVETAVSRLYAAERNDGSLPGALVCKVIAVADDAFSSALAERARAILEVGSPHLMPVLDVGRYGSQLIVVRPRLRALTLTEIVDVARKSRRSISHGVAVRMVVDVLTGLQSAHAHKTAANGAPLLTHGEVSPDHVMVDDTGRVLLIGLETPRGSTPAAPPALKFDLSGACALLYDLLAPKKGVENAVPAPPIPPEFAAVLTSAMGIGGPARHKSAAELRDAFLQTAKKAQVSVASHDDVASVMRRLLENVAPLAQSPAWSPPPASTRPPSSPPPAEGLQPPASPPPPAAPTPTSEPAPSMPSMQGSIGGAGMFAAPRPISGIFNVPKNMKRRLGELLKERGIIDDAQLDAALARQKVNKGKLGEILLEDHFIDDGQLADALAELSKLERADDGQVSGAAPSEFLRASVPTSLAVGKRLMPISMDGGTGTLVIAVADPFDSASVRQVQLLLGAQSVRVVVARRGAIDMLLTRLFPKEMPKPSPVERTEPQIRVSELERTEPRVMNPMVPRPLSSPRLAPVVDRPAPSAPVGGARVGPPSLFAAAPPAPVAREQPPAPTPQPTQNRFDVMPTLARGPPPAMAAPAAPPPPAEPPPPSPPPEPGALRTLDLSSLRPATSDVSTAGSLVLLCEPDPILSAALVTRLKAEEFRVLVVTDGQQARAAIDKEPPMAVIAEAALPKVDGFNLLLTARSRDATREMPFFLLSARTDEAHSSKALELGADDFLPKPLNTELFVTKLRRAVARYTAVEKTRLEAEMHRKRADASKQAAGGVRMEPTGVSGTLQQMGLPEIVQSLELGRKTAVVTLMFGTQQEGTVAFIEGEVISALCGKSIGPDAFYELATKREGFFKIHYGPPTDPARNINVSTTFLLLESMRRLDEEHNSG